eukprot:TRINITY_DN17727_c0_g1_i1.p1 TRINITY_DN17727_c0_g1~~TRINITY_DN17727_c0_g1_i1.p1  ORF type:complete len:492 (+),score=61.20 TRINITY_DN17727_c0_g1_i1:45-1520(+)
MDSADFRPAATMNEEGVTFLESTGGPHRPGEVLKDLTSPSWDEGLDSSSLGKYSLLELAEMVEGMISRGVNSTDAYRAIAGAASYSLKESAAEFDASSAERQLAPAAQLLRLLSAAGLASPELVNALATRVLQYILRPESSRQLPPRVVTRCIAGLALSTQDRRAVAALKGLANVATACIAELTPEDRALICWSLALQGCYEGFLDLALGQTQWSSWSAQPAQASPVSATAHSAGGMLGAPAAAAKLAVLQQAFLADLGLRVEGGGNRPGLAAHRDWVISTVKGVLASRSSLSSSPEATTIAQALKLMDLHGALNCQTAEGIPLCVRVSARETASSKISIEVDRPEDFVLDVSSGRARHFMPTTFRRRLLWHLGHTVVVVPYYEVRGCTETQVMQLLKAKLTAIRPGRAPSPRQSLHDASQREGVTQRLRVPGCEEFSDGRPLLADTCGTRVDRTSSAGTAGSSSCSDHDNMPGTGSPWLRHSVRPPPGLG